jgi:cation-transporting ATPase 13A2
MPSFRNGVSTDNANVVHETAAPYGTMSQQHAVINLTDETIHIWGYHKKLWKEVIVWILTILTAGIFQLILHWYPSLFVKFTSSKCPLSVCDHVLVRDDHENIAFRPVRVHRSKNGSHLAMPAGGGQLVEVERIRFFSYRKLTYIWHPNELRFATVGQLEAELPLSYFHDCCRSGLGLTDTDVEQRMLTYGRNLIEVKLKPIIVLLFKEVITPFYIFQVFSVLVWYNDDYAYYASVIVIMSLLSICMDVYQIRKQEKRLRNMVHSHENVEVLRNGQTLQTSSESLVPGDILLIPPHGCILQCDAILMNGTVIVNESMLTGESVPVTKVALPDTEGEDEEVFSFKEHSKHVLYCGTQVLQTRYYGGKHVQAVVLRTAYSTLKGQLVRSIMYPKPVDFRFTKDLFKFVGFLACIAGVGFIYTITIMILRGSVVKKIILRSLDIITIVVPPALPAAMSIGIIAAQMRLRAKQIFCISPSTINTCGAINTVCFDKTGTLTEDGLDFNCLRAVYHTEGHSPEFGNELKEFQADELPGDGELLKAVATCHSLTRCFVL